MTPRKRKKLRTFLSCLLVIALSPLMILSVTTLLPLAESFALKAISASAEINGGTIKFDDEDEKTKDVQTQTNTSVLTESNELSEKEVQQQVIKEVKTEQKNIYSIDDTNMLSLSVLQIPSSENEELVVPEREGDPGPEPYPDSLESRDGKIQNICYEYMTGGSYIDLEKAGQVRNNTDISNDYLYEESLKLPDFKIELNGEPQVLIYHTHTTESFEPYERNFYDSSFNSRTTDASMSVISVGDRIALELEKNGIGVIHDTTLHDYPSYNGSYDNSRETVEKILKENPSIKVVLDIHRDAIEKQDGTRIAPVTEINGKNAGQIMIVSNCNSRTTVIPEYKKNFRLASLLEQQIESDYPTLTRPVLFDYRFYNQDLSTGSLLIEVGGHANSIEQVRYSGELLGKSLAKALLSISEDT